MEYRGYRVEAHNNRIIVDNVRDFNPVHTFECGQCFRWIRQPDGSYNGIVRDRAVNVHIDGSRLVIYNAGFDDFYSLWFDYFDLGTDYAEIKKAVNRDDAMEAAIKYGYGIRLLKQDLWEMLISFIISANNRIPRIMKTVDTISQMYGREIEAGERTAFSFPEAQSLAESSIEKLNICKGGFRCKYILKTARAVSEGSFSLSALGAMETGCAREELIRLPGVGPKVADCILLYSGTKRDVFPTDVWVKRVMEELYFKREASFKEIQDFSSEYFGHLRGFAQQYLFYYARENKIGTS